MATTTPIATASTDHGALEQRVSVVAEETEELELNDSNNSNSYVNVEVAYSSTLSTISSMA